MTESTFTSKLLSALRQRLPDAVVVKFSDRITAGIPDFAVIRKGHIFPYEVKLSTHKKMFAPLQQETLKKWGGNYIVWSVRWRTGWIFSPYDTEHWGDGMPFYALVERIVKEARP